MYVTCERTVVTTVRKRVVEKPVYFSLTCFASVACGRVGSYRTQEVPMPTSILSPLVDQSVEVVLATHIRVNDDNDDMYATERADDQRLRIHVKNVKEFGSGNFSRVYTADLQTSDKRFAVAIKKCRIDSRVKTREVSILRSLNHPNVVKLFYFFWNDNEKHKELNLVLEFVPDTLYRVRKDTPGHIALDDILKFMWQLLNAVKHIHSLRICHRDIKPQNILVEKTSGLLKLADFGSAKIIAERDTHGSSPYIVSRHYRAPELLLGNKRYSFQIDIWSCGCVLGELIQKHVLFPGNDQAEQMRLIVSMLGSPTYGDMEVLRPGYAAKVEHNTGKKVNMHDRLTTVPAKSWMQKFKTERNDIGEVMCKLIDGMLLYHPMKRLTAIQSLTHPAFNQRKQAQGGISMTTQTENLLVI